MLNDTDSVPDFFQAFFPAKVTATQLGTDDMAATNIYEWNEQTLDPTTGLYMDLDGGRQGTFDQDPAIEKNNQLVGALPTIVNMQFGCTGGNGGTLHVFDVSGGGGAPQVYDFHSWIPDVQSGVGNARGYLAPGNPFGDYAVTGAPAAGVAYAIPFINPLRTKMERMGIWLDSYGSSGSKCRVALYQDVLSPTSAQEVDGVAFSQPGELVWDSGDMDLSAPSGGGLAGFYFTLTDVENVELSASSIYWFITNFNDATASVGMISTASMQGMFGTSQNEWKALFGYKSVQPYGAWDANNWALTTTELTDLTGTVIVPVAVVLPFYHFTQ